MYKAFKKYIAIIVISIVLNLAFSTTVSLAADGPDTVFAGLKDCIELTKKLSDTDEEPMPPGKDDGKIITILEESLGDGFDDETDDSFESRTCYRQSYVYSKTNVVLSKLTEKACSTDLAKQASDSGDVYACYEVLVLLSDGGTSMIFGYIGMIYRWGASMAGIVAALILVVSGIQISVSGGDSEAISKSKERIIRSLGGIAVLFLSGIILYTINPTFFTT
jgi:hypothetical protein